MAAKIFISYSRQDQREAMALSELLRAEGLTVWIDQDAIQTASIWSGEIVDNLKNCDLFIVLLSGHSATSHNVSKELALASENKKIIFPIELERVGLPSPMEYALAGIHRGSWKDKEAIVRGVKRHIAEATVHAENVLLPAKPQRRLLWTVAGAVVLVIAVLLYAFVFRGKEEANVGAKAQIATLPFTVVNFDQDSVQNLDVFADAIISRLSTSDELQVVDRSRASSFKSSTLNPIAIAKELHSRFIIDGTVRKMRDQLTVCVRLYDTKMGADIWSNEYAGGMRELLTIRDSLSDDVTNVANGVMSAEKRLMNAEQRLKDHPNDAMAYENLGGLLSYSNKDRAATFFKRAIELDSVNERFYLDLMIGYDRMHDVVRSREVARRSLPIFEKAIALHPDSIGLRIEYALALDYGGNHDRGVNYSIDLVKQLPRWRASETAAELVYYNAACVLAKNNTKLDLALDYLDSATRSGNYRDAGTSDPDLDNLRNMPRYRQIMHEK